MKITDIKINKNIEGKVLANVMLTFDDSFVVSGIKIIEGSKGPFVAMPSMKTNDPEKPYKDTMYPTNKEFREYLIGEVMDKFNFGKNQPNGHF